MNMKISAIIINYNTPEMTERCIRTLIKTVDDLIMEIILIDNASQKKLSAQVIENLGVKYIANEKNLGFAGAVNVGLSQAQGEYVLLLNSDIIVSSKSIDTLIQYLENNQKVGIAGPKFIHPDGYIQPSAGFFPTVWREILRFTSLWILLPGSTLLGNNLFTINKFKNNAMLVDWISGGCMLIKKEVIEKVGLFDSKYFFGIEDWDYCWRTKLVGFDIAFVATAKIQHYHGYSSGGRGSVFSTHHEKEGAKYFFEKNLPKKIISKNIIQLMYQFKIWIKEIRSAIKILK